MDRGIHLLAHTPRFSIRNASTIAEELYGIRATASQLPSERDQNFLLISESEEKFVLKIANGVEEPALLEAQNQILQYLTPRFPHCQRPIRSTHGRYLEQIRSMEGVTNLVRLNTYLPGIPLGEVNTHSSELLNDFGLKLGLLDKELLDFDHPAVHRRFHWDLANAVSVVAEYVDLIANASLKEAVSWCKEDFVIAVSASLDQLPRSVIHGDVNDYNVLVSPEASSVVGFLDFGDTVYSYTVGDLAIALAYVVLGKAEPLSAATSVAAGYNRSRPLSAIEIKVLWPMMLMRLCMSVCLAAYQQLQQPNNEYLDISQQAIRESLPKLLAIDPQEATWALRHTLSTGFHD